MSENEINFDEIEQKYKEDIFNKIGELISSQNEIVEVIKNNINALGQVNVDIPNLGITMNNKLVELSRIFQMSGISMFSSSYVEYLSWGDYKGTSLIGDAIIYDLIDELNESVVKLNEYSKKIDEIFEKRRNKFLIPKQANPIKKFWFKIKSFFARINPQNIELSKEEQASLDEALIEYKKIDNRIWEYNLQDRLVSALVKHLSRPEKINGITIPHKYGFDAILDFMRDEIIPDLKKLGLENIIPNLYDSLSKAYNQDISTLEKKDLEVEETKKEDVVNGDGDRDNDESR